MTPEFKKGIVSFGICTSGTRILLSRGLVGLFRSRFGKPEKSERKIQRNFNLLKALV